MQTLAEPVAHAARRGNQFLLGVAATTTTALLLWLSHFPCHRGELAWVALVPWLLLVRSDMGWKQRYFCAWLGGYLFLLPAISWMRVAHEAMLYSWLGLSWYCSWYFAFAMLLLRWLDRRTTLPLCVTMPLVWTACEFTRGTFGGGFPWYFLGHTQHDFPAVLQLADLGGSWAVTFLVAAVNGLLAEWLLGRLRPNDARPFLPQLVGVAGLMVAALAYGGWRLTTYESRPGPTIALLQTDLAQSARNAANDPDPDHVKRAQTSIEEQTFVLSRRVRDVEPKPDLVIWPETTFELDDIELDADGPFLPDLARARMAARTLLDTRTKYVGTSVLYGLNTRVYDRAGKVRRYNSALLVSPDGTRHGRYDKTHLVPFGEYIPLREELPWMDKLAPYDEGKVTLLTPGRAFTRFRLPTRDGQEYTFGAVVCYEDSYGELTRQYVRPSSERPVDFLVNITNDGWFYPTSEHEEHLAISRFRAVECRRPLVRAVNMGISAVIDGTGRVVALPGPTWAKSKGVLEIVSATVPLDGRSSLYALVGDWLPWSCWGMVVAFGLCGRRCARCA